MANILWLGVIEMLGTKGLAPRIGGAAIAILVAGLGFLGVTGVAKAADEPAISPEGLVDVYCYTEPVEQANERIRLDHGTIDIVGPSWVLAYNGQQQKLDPDSKAYVDHGGAFSAAVDRSSRDEMAALHESIAGNPSRICAALVGWSYGTPA